MSQEFMDLGIMQRKHFALDQINHAVDLMQSLSHAGNTHDAYVACALEHVQVVWVHVRCTADSI